jgi:hypothetical protein
MTIKAGEHTSPKTEYKTLYPVSDTGMKICTHCSKEKDVSDFGKYKNGNPLPHCKKCENKKMRKFRIDNPKSTRTATKSYYQKNRDYWRLYNRCRGVGITIKDYLEIFRTHNGCCDICGTSHLELNKALGIDHDHVTGKIRGLLCNNCNVALGGFRDSPEVLEKAVSYLKKHQEVKA